MTENYTLLYPQKRRLYIQEDDASVVRRVSNQDNLPLPDNSRRPPLGLVPLGAQCLCSFKAQKTALLISRIRANVLTGSIFLHISNHVALFIHSIYVVRSRCPQV